MPKKEQRPLDPVYQDAESSYGGKIATIQRACIKTGAKRKWGEVLRWYLEHGAEEHPVESRAKVIAASYFVGASERTVQKANAHWKKLKALIFQERWDNNGSPLPPWASLDWRTVVQLASGQSAGTNPVVPTREVTKSRRNSTTGCDGSFSWQVVPRVVA